MSTIAKTMDNHWTIFAIIAVLQISYISNFDLNDPKTNLESFIRVGGSLAQNQSAYNYFNGTVYGKTKNGTRKIFYFEGFNVGVKQRQGNGDYVSLSREFAVYRDIESYGILNVWQNVFNQLPNEVFFVANDPVNAHFHLGDMIPYSVLPYQLVTFDADIVLEYPNALSPKNYPKYSAGEIYDSAELFSYYANYTTLASTTSPSVVYTGTWSRHSQFLPWMEMSTTPGSLFYNTFSWKCPSLQDCLPNDIAEIIKSNFTKYFNAPTEYEKPNETSWTRFKKAIDKRRAGGLPDIVIPMVNISGNGHMAKESIDEAVINVFNNGEMMLYYNGTSFTQIYGRNSITLFNVEGYINVTVTTKPASPYVYIRSSISCTLKDPVTGRSLNRFFNPLINKTISVQPFFTNYDRNIPKESAFSMDIAPSGVIGFMMTDSISHVDRKTARERWSVNQVQAVFPKNELNKPLALVYGTLTQFGSWPAWLEMDKIPGNMITKAHFYRV